MKLTTTTWVTVDGVMQGLGAADEDTRGGFDRGGWAMPLSDPQVEAALNDVYSSSDAFLFGHWTFDVFAKSWGTIPEMQDSAIGRALNSKPKYVVSSSLTDPSWAPTTVLAPESVAVIEDLKSQSGNRLLVPGSLSLVRWLLEQDLVDEINLFVAPLVVGDGKRLFPDAGRDLALELAESTVMDNGVIVVTYRTAGRPQYGRTADTTTAWTE